MAEAENSVDCVVIGAGVVGLAVARAIAMSTRFQNKDILILEAANAIGTGASSRNSEVIHAGIYYPPGSLKARLCVPGKTQLYNYCEERGIGFNRCGKLIVASSEAQVPHLQAMMTKAAANGVHDLVLLTRDQAQQLEPALQCHAAIHSPSTGIVDSHALMLSLQGDFENAGGILALNSSVDKVYIVNNDINIIANDGTTLQTKVLVNAAGLYAPLLARQFVGLDHKHIPHPYYAKGNYFTLSGKSPFKRLIYPVPESAGLGVHFTLDMGAQAKFGPDVEWVDTPEDLKVDERCGDAFYAEVRKYWPQLKDGRLVAGYAGIRPKISGPDAAAADFLIQGEKEHGIKGLVNLFGVESPGLTSCMAIGDHVVQMLSE